MRPLDELDRPLAAAPGGRWIERMVGVAAVLAGLALAVLAITAVFSGAAVGSAALAFGAVVGLLAAFFLTVGWRLLLTRPNRHGGLLSPVFCLVAGAFFVLAGLAMGINAVRLGRFAELEGALSAIALGALAAWFGWRHRRAREAL